MPATIIKVPVIEDIHRAINKAVDDHKDKDVFVYFYASIDPATGKSWCPDCVTGKHIPPLFFSSQPSLLLPLKFQLDRTLNTRSNHCVLLYDEIAGPIVEEYFSKIDNAVLVDAPVGDRPKYASHQARSS